jgi:transposase-like protein
MTMRLGDYIDDHCSRCKRTTDHAVVSMAGEEVLKVRCRTCGSDHTYRHNQSGKKEMTKEEAFQKVLAGVTGQMEGKSADNAKPAKKKRTK